MNFIPKIVYNSIALNFTLPTSDDPFNETITPDNNEAMSKAGVIQASSNFLEESRTITLTFLSKSQLDSIRTFFNNWGSLRKSFDYYPSNDDGTFYSYTLTNKNLQVKRLISDGSGDFIYEVTLSMRRVL